MPLRIIVSCMSLAMFASSFCMADEAADAAAKVRSALEAQKIRASGTTIFLISEGELPRLLEKANDLKKTLTKQTKEYAAFQQQFDNASRQMLNLRAEHVRYSAALTQVQPGDIDGNNRIVGALNAIDGQLEILQTQKTAAEEHAKGMRAKLNEAREEYLQFVIDLRAKADEINAEYEAKKSSKDIAETVKLASETAKRDFTFGPSASYTAAIKKLKGLEDTVLSETIPLQRDRNTLHVSVVVNGKHTEIMVLDSGASSISLPLKMAEKFGITPSSGDEKIRVSLADGSVISGHRKILSSVRVGKFTVNNVECIVLGPEAVNAEPLLGMTFLGNFKFEVNADAKTLTMVKIAGDEKSSK